MKSGRITFEGNPWPEGHAIKEFQWDAYIKDGCVWFRLNLETEDYDSERKIRDEGDQPVSDWQSPGVWNNYHSCTISGEGFPVCPVADFSPQYLVGRVLRVDELPLAKEMDDLAFSIYLLGHDSVADHSIQFFRNHEEREIFDILWEGKIALAYVEEDEYRYRFKTEIKGVPMPIFENK